MTPANPITRWMYSHMGNVQRNASNTIFVTETIHRCPNLQTRFAKRIHFRAARKSQTNAFALHRVNNDMQDRNCLTHSNVSTHLATVEVQFETVCATETTHRSPNVHTTVKIAARRIRRVSGTVSQWSQNSTPNVSNRQSRKPHTAIANIIYFASLA